MFKKLLSHKQTKQFFFIFFGALAFLFPLVAALTSIFSASIAFWYDPARDSLLALQNLSKFTLIGPPSGIPGIFYGPYWIWLLSMGMLFSKDIRIVTLFTETLPYFIGFPLLLLTFRRIFGLHILILLWLLFILYFNNYAVQLWNPHLAPLFFLSIISLVTFTNYFQTDLKTCLKTFLLGVMTALTLNFHISFGLGLTLGVGLFLLMHTVIDIFQNKKERGKLILQKIVLLLLFVSGFLITFLPFFAFEYRHGFQQTQTVLKTISSPVAVVTQKGMTKQDIIIAFFGRLSEVFMLPNFVIAVASVAAFGYLFASRLKKLDLSNQEVKLLVFLAVVSTCILILYLLSKNPVWQYHFISVEIIFLFILAFIVKKFSILRKVLTVYVSIIFVMHVVSFSQSLASDPAKLNSLAAEEQIVEKIVSDAHNTDYTVFAYNPSIYSFEYSYLFKMKGKDMPYDPGLISPGAGRIYLILPVAKEQIKNDFIEYRTPSLHYKTAAVWKMLNGSTIIKREKK